MYKAFGMITCDCCGTEVSSIDFIVVKSKEGIQHFCNEECKNCNKNSGLLSEVERNTRLFMLLDKLVADKDIKSIELIKTWIENDTPSMKKSFDIVEKSGNFNFAD